KTKKQLEAEEEEEENEDEDSSPDEPTPISDSEVGMGGPDGRVYWPPGQEHWLRPVKKVVKPKVDKKAPPGKEVDEQGRIVTAAMKRKRAKEGEEAVNAAQKEGEMLAMKVERVVDEGVEGAAEESMKGKGKGKKGNGEKIDNRDDKMKGGDKKKAGGKSAKKKSVKPEPEQVEQTVTTAPSLGRRQSTRGKKVDYAEE
ncbi:MAG: hypothetical protein Q9204_007630, partial [Flavoplaca sp. TL-2023a]